MSGFNRACRKAEWFGRRAGECFYHRLGEQLKRDRVETGFRAGRRIRFQRPAEDDGFAGWILAPVKKKFGFQIV